MPFWMPRYRLWARPLRHKHMDPKLSAATVMPTVLVVDDEMLIRWALAESLASAGFAVVQAGTAREALERVASPAGRIAVALLDLRLPDSTGTLACCDESAPWTRRAR